MRKQLTRLAGFTMIELLVVIAVIGILAVATLSAINPIEQINKGKDTRTRSDASELLSAVERYYSTQEQYPWNAATTAVAPYAAWTAIPTTTAAFSTDGALAWIQNLATANEVKPAFASRLYNNYQSKTIAAGTNEFVLLKAANSDEVRACFVPSSKQFKLEAVRKCCAATAVDGKCADVAASGLKGSTPLNVIAPAGTTFTLCDNNAGNDSVAASVFYICLP